MPAMPCPRAARGFTLVELLLATVLLALLVAGAWSGIRTATRAASSGEELIERTNRVRVAQEFLRRELTQSLALAYEEEVGTGQRLMFGGERDELTFVAPMPGYLGRGGPYVQQLSFVSGNGGRQLVFHHALLNGYDAREESVERRSEPVVLLDVDGFWAPLFDWMNASVAAGFVRDSHRMLAQRAVTVDDAIALATSPVPHVGHKWLDRDPTPARGTALT